MNLTCPATEIAQVSASQACLHEAERSVIGMEIQKLYNKGVISKCTPQARQFVSPVFVRPKKDENRMILNLKHGMKISPTIILNGHASESIDTGVSKLLHGINRSERCLLFSINPGN